MISAEPLICTHQAFIFSSISAYPPWYQLVIFSLAILVPRLCLGGMLGLESGVIFFFTLLQGPQSDIYSDIKKLTAASALL